MWLLDRGYDYEAWPVVAFSPVCAEEWEPGPSLSVSRFSLSLLYLFMPTPQIRSNKIKYEYIRHSIVKEDVLLQTLNISLCLSLIRFLGDLIASIIAVTRPFL